VKHRTIKLRHFARWLRERREMDDPNIREVQLPLIRQFGVYVTEERGCVPKTVRGYLEALRAMFSYLKEYNYVADSPAHRMKMPRNNPPEREMVSNEELIRLFEA
jgi:site-specific recombinase XerD